MAPHHVSAVAVVAAHAYAGRKADLRAVAAAVVVQADFVLGAVGVDVGDPFVASVAPRDVIRVRAVDCTLHVVAAASAA